MIDLLRERLDSAGYTVDAVLERITDAGQEGLLRNSTTPALVALGDDRDPLATLIRLFPLHRGVPVADVRAALPVDESVALGLLAVEGDGRAHATVDIRPYGFETSGGPVSRWLVSDHTPGLDHDRTPMRPDYVLGASPASTTLAQLSIPDEVASALDLGTGCGVQSVHLATHASRVTATDVNQRALDLARLTTGLNGLDVDLRKGSLYEPVAADRFDLIVTNPPYVVSPPSTDAGRLMYREGGFRGDDLVRAVVEGAPARLNPGGTLQVLANWIVTDEPWEERLAGWAPPGCDLWVIERERLDPFAYIEMWLADAGLAGHPSWDDRYREWLDYFGELGVRGIGMGWITVVNAERTDPRVVIESWPHEVAQPVGPALSAHRRATGQAAAPDRDLLAARWVLRDDVVQETFGRPGAADPEYVILRQGAGLKRAMRVDTAFGGVMGACDGTLPLGAIIGAVAQLLDEDAASLTGRVLPRIRVAVEEGYLDRS